MYAYSAQFSCLSSLSQIAQSHLQNSWTAICFSTLAQFLAEISARSTTMHFIPAKYWPQIGFADYPPRILQVDPQLKIHMQHNLLK